MRENAIKKWITFVFAAIATVPSVAMDTSGFIDGRGYATPQSVRSYVDPILQKAEKDLVDIGKKYEEKVEAFNSDGDDDDDAGMLHPENNDWKPEKFHEAVRDEFIHDDIKNSSFGQTDRQSELSPQKISSYAKKTSGITNVRDYDKEIESIVKLIKDLGNKCDVKSQYIQILNELWEVAKNVHKAYFAATYAQTQEKGYENFLSIARGRVVAAGNKYFNAANNAAFAQENTHYSTLKQEVDSIVDACLSSCSPGCDCPPPPETEEGGESDAGSGS